jgi:hypothetical protein
MKFRITDTPSKRGDIFRGPDGRWRVHPSGRVVEIPAIDPSDRGPAGRDGRDGKNGVDGQDGKDAEPSINWRNKWRRGEYAPGDAVTHEGSSYIATAVTRAEPPGRGWSVLAAKGDDGQDGAEFYTRVVKRVETVGGSVETITALFASATPKGAPLFISVGSVQLAQANGIVHVVGVAAEDVAEGAEGRYITDGRVERDDWSPITGTGSASLVPGAVYLLDPETPGRITPTAPTNAGHVCLTIGRALNTTVLDVEIGEPILLSEEPEE